MPEDRRTRTTAGGSPLWQSTRSIPEPEAAASALQELPWTGDVHLGSYCDGSEIPLQCQMVIQGKELGRNLVKSEDSLLSKF